MKNYELTLLISPDLAEAEVKNFQEKITEEIQKEGGILSESKNSGKKKLAAPIKKKETAYFNALNFSLASKKLSSLEKKLKSETSLLRYLILTKPKAKILPTRPKRIPFLTKTPLEKVLKPEKPFLKTVKPKEKVELKEIEKKLDEILGET